MEILRGLGTTLALIMPPKNKKDDSPKKKSLLPLSDETTELTRVATLLSTN